MNEAPILEVENLKKSFFSTDGDNLQILKGISFELEKGKTLAIVGESGGGKSTLLSLLCGLDRADSGRIFLDGQDICSMDEKKLSAYRSRRIGIVFQHFYLMPHLNAQENVSLPMELVNDPHFRERSEHLLEKVGLGHRLRYPVGKLSGGEMQRVAIARAIANHPSLLVADEPTGNLDENTSNHLVDFLFDLVKTEEMSSVIVTHNLEIAKRCDVVLTLKEGILQ